MWGKALKKPIEIMYREPKPNGFICMSEYGRVGFTPMQNLAQFEETGLYFDIKLVEQVNTPEGPVIAVPGVDYVLKGVDGELYPIKKTIFEKTYDVTTPIPKKCPYGAKNKSECSHIDCIGECE